LASDEFVRRRTNNPWVDLVHCKLQGTSRARFGSAESACRPRKSWGIRTDKDLGHYWSA